MSEKTNEEIDPWELPVVEGDPLPEAELDRLDACYGRFYPRRGDTERDLRSCETAIARLVREVRRLRSTDPGQP